MTRVPPTQILVALHRFILRILKLNPCQKFLEAIFRRLTYLWSILRSGWGARRKGGSGRGGPPGPSPGGVQMALNFQAEDGPEANGSSVPQDEHSEPATPAYTTTSDGGAISLQGISCSVFPYGNSIHSASRSTQNLRHATSAHNIATSRRGSRVSLHSSNFSHPPSAHDEHYTIQVQPISPAPRRQYSSSSPEIGKLTPYGFLTDQATWTPHLAASGPQSSSPSSSVEILSLSGSRLSVEVPLSEMDKVSCLDQPHCVTDMAESKMDKAPCLGHLHLTPIVPESFQRYQKRQIMTKEVQEFEFPPLTTEFIDHPNPLGWTYFAHPEGAAYFYHEEKKIFTDTNLFDHRLLGRINQDIELIESYFTDNDLTRPSGSDLVLDLNYDLDCPARLLTHYYLANHASRVIFFLDAWNPDRLNSWSEVSGVTSIRQIGHEMEAQYWYHCQSYPNCLQLATGTISELRDNVMHLIGDCMTSPYSTSPYTLDDLHKILSLSGSLEQNAGTPSMGSMTLICRFFYVFARTRFLNFHGTPAARLERDHSVYGIVTRRTWLIKTSSIFLFSAPDVHLRVLHKLWVDELLHKGFYEQAMKKMNDEWQEFILFATVLLNANVAFLAIQSVDVDGPDRSGAQISSYVSVFMSVGSIIMGLLLVRQTRTKHRDSAADVQKWLQNKSHPLLGLETLAIMFSLPYALLMWGMVSFLCSFSIMVFWKSSTPARVIVGIFGVIIAFLIGWCVFTAWEKQPVPEGLARLPGIPENNDEPHDEDSQSPNIFCVSPQNTSSLATTTPTRRWVRSPFSFFQSRSQSGDSDETVV